MRMIHHIKPVIIFILLAMAGACNEYFGLSVDCDECFYEEPDSADLIIYVTLTDDHPEVPIVVYRGKVESRQVDWVDTVLESPYHLYSAVDQFYSVEAEYRVGNKKVIAVDGDIMKTKHVSESCDQECWLITGGYLKAELKFDE